MNENKENEEEIKDISFKDNTENQEDKSTEEFNPFKGTIKYRYNNKNTVRIYRNYKCLDCGQRFEKFDQLLKHAIHQHKNLIGDQDPYKYLYEKRNPGPYICTICHKRERSWNEKTHKYNRICDNSECIKKSREIFSKNMKRIYGTDNLAKDPEYQARIVANRHISGTYKFKDGNQIGYVGKYEEDFLKHCETKFEFDSTDICPVPGSLYIQYFDPTLNRNRWYIPDFYLPKYNLVVEIKDASKYPVESKALMTLKENAVIKANKFNYIKIVEKRYKDFDEFIEAFHENNYSIEKRDSKFTIIIPEIV